MSRTRKNYPASFKMKVVIAFLREDCPVVKTGIPVWGSSDGNRSLQTGDPGFHGGWFFQQVGY